jgi:hypothetical protein
MLDAIVLTDDRVPARPASAARLRAMARHLSRAIAEDDPAWHHGLGRAAARLVLEDRVRLKVIRARGWLGAWRPPTWRARRGRAGRADQHQPNHARCI